MKFAENDPRIRAGVKRYHVWPTTQQQTVAEHEYHVLRIYSQIWGFPEPRIGDYIIGHDARVEMVTGDVPYQAKLQFPQLKAVLTEIEEELLRDQNVPILDVEELARVKFCDIAEMYEFGLMELALGNSFGQSIVDATYMHLRSLISRMEDEDKMRCDRFLQNHTQKHWSNR